VLYLSSILSVCIEEIDKEHIEKTEIIQKPQKIEREDTTGNGFT